MPHRAFQFVKLICFLLVLPSCTGVFYQPDSYMYYPPEVFGFKREEIYFLNSDVLGLHGWFFRAAGKKPKGTIVEFHGNAENISSHYVSLVWLVKEGYNLFVFDYRGFGESRGTPSQVGLYKDGLAAIEEGWKLHQQAGGGKFIIYGQSLGGAVAMRSFLDSKHQKDTNLLVMDSTFISYKDVARRNLASSWVTWLVSPLGSLLVSDEYAPEPVLSRLHTRLLVIHDKRDPVVAFQNGVDLFQNAPEPKEFWQLNQGLHVGTFSENQTEFRKRFVALVGNL